MTAVTQTHLSKWVLYCKVISLKVKNKVISQMTSLLQTFQNFFFRKEICSLWAMARKTQSHYFIISKLYVYNNNNNKLTLTERRPGLPSKSPPSAAMLSQSVLTSHYFWPLSAVLPLTTYWSHSPRTLWLSSLLFPGFNHQLLYRQPHTSQPHHLHRNVHLPKNSKTKQNSTCPKLTSLFSKQFRLITFLLLVKPWLSTGHP